MIEISGVGIATAFVAGMISFVSPCVLPLVPGYVAYITGESLSAKAQGGADRLRVPALSLCFVVGFSTVFVLLGAGAGALSTLLLAYRYEANLIGGTLVVMFGLFTAGVLPLSWLERDLRWHSSLRGGTALGAYLLGIAFAFGWTPCIGPVLGAILAVAATSTSPGSGMALLSVYSLGLGVPFVLAALFTNRLLTARKAIGRVGRFLKVAAGLAMVLMGLAMVSNRLSDVAIWFLKTFPVLGVIG